jgi:hypothetical protein
VGDRRFGVPVRIQYAAAFSRGVSYGVAPYSGRRIELADPEPGLLSTPHKGFANHLLQIIQPLASQALPQECCEPASCPGLIA